jgi:Zn-dependent protease with chaperone function
VKFKYPFFAICLLTLTAFTLESSVRTERIDRAIEEYGIAPSSVRAKIVRAYITKIINRLDVHLVFKEEHPPLHNSVERLSRKMGIKKPIVLISRSYESAASQKLPGMPAIIIIGAPLITTLSDAECEALVAHELSHIAQNHSIKQYGGIMALTAGISTAIHLYFESREKKRNVDPSFRAKNLLQKAPIVIAHLSAHAVTNILGLLIACLVQAKISRSHEYAADALAAEIVGVEPCRALLQKTSAKKSQHDQKINEWSAHASNQENRWYTRLRYRAALWLTKNLRTHPIWEDRIAALATK